MSFIRYKQRGTQWYVYQVENIWNKELKKYTQQSVYLGVAGNKGGEYCKKEIKLIEKNVLDFGDSYIIHRVFTSINLDAILANTVQDTNNISLC